MLAAAAQLLRDVSRRKHGWIYLGFGETTIRAIEQPFAADAGTVCSAGTAGTEADGNHKSQDAVTRLMPVLTTILCGALLVALALNVAPFLEGNSTWDRRFGVDSWSPDKPRHPTQLDGGPG